MKISKERIKEIIKEEISLVLSEYDDYLEEDEGDPDIQDWDVSEADSDPSDVTDDEADNEKPDKIISEVNRWLSLAGINQD